MPEFTVKEVRLPELHLPEIKREEIVRSLSGHLPEVDLARARQASFKVPAVTLSGSDIGRLLAAVAAVARLVRPTSSRGRWLTGRAGRGSRWSVARIVKPRPNRSRLPIALGAVILAVIGSWVVLRRPAVRQRVEAAARRAREQFDVLVSTQLNPEITTEEPIAFSAAETAPVRAEGFVSASEDADRSASPKAAEYVDGLGSNGSSTDGVSSRKGSGKRG